MNPAFSVIFFTVFSGAGYGLLALLGLGVAFGLLPTDQWLGILGLGLGFSTVSAGLLSSTWHLGHPERAWRAFSQWRTSWLSREGVISVVTFGPILLLGYAWIVGTKAPSQLVVWGGLTAIGALGTVACTGMIYQSLKTVHQWHNHLTVPNYLLLGLAGGAVWLNGLTVILNLTTKAVAGVAVVAVVSAWLTKRAYWRFIETTSHQATRESATGLGQFGEVSKFEIPHTEQNYLQKEMGYQIARKHAAKLRYYVEGLAFAVPLALVAMSVGTGGAIAAFTAGLAMVCMTMGLLIERWLFFAEAKHVVMLYYGAKSA